MGSALVTFVFGPSSNESERTATFPSCSCNGVNRQTLMFRDLRRLKQASSNAAGSVNRPISLKNSKNCRSKRLAIAWMKRIAEPGSKRKNVGTSESELGVSSTEGQADRPSRLAAG